MTAEKDAPRVDPKSEHVSLQASAKASGVDSRRRSRRVKREFEKGT